MHTLGPPKKTCYLLRFFNVGRPFFWGAKGVQKGCAKLHLAILKCRVRISRNPTRISRKCIRKDHVETYEKKHDRWLCFTLFWGKNCALSLRQTLQDEILKDKIDMYRKRYTRVFVNPCKPFAHALPGIMISSRRQLFLSYIHVWQSWLSANVVCKCHWLQQNEF